MLRPIGPERDFLRRVGRRYGLDFTIINEMVEEEGEYGPEPLRKATDPELQMWALLVPADLRERVSGVFQGSDLTLEATYEEVRGAILRGPIVYLNPMDYGVLRAHHLTPLFPNVEIIVDAERVKAGWAMTWPSAAVYISPHIPQGCAHYRELPDPKLQDESATLNDYDYPLEPLLTPRSLPLEEAADLATTPDGRVKPIPLHGGAALLALVRSVLAGRRNCLRGKRHILAGTNSSEAFVVEVRGGGRLGPGFGRHDRRVHRLITAVVYLVPVMNLYLAKGVRISGTVQRTYLPCLAGMQMKVGLEYIPVTGTIRHLRSEFANPTAKDMHILIDPDEGYDGPTIDLHCPCGHPHADVRPWNIREVLGEPILAKDAILILELQEEPK